MVCIHSRSIVATNGIPRRQRFAARPALGKLIPRSTKATDYQITEARGYGYTLREVGAHLGIHYATVSRRAGRYKRLAKRKKRDYSAKGISEEVISIPVFLSITRKVAARASFSLCGPTMILSIGSFMSAKPKSSVYGTS